MKRTTLPLALAGVMLVGVGLATGYELGKYRIGDANRGQVAAALEKAAPKPMLPSASSQPVDPKIGARVLYWHDPMVPGPRFDKPGKSPFMDMELVPVYADADADEGKVSISPRTQQNLGVRIAEVSAGQLEMGFSAVGAVTIDERGIVAIQSRVNGYVEKLYVRAQYDVVSKGQSLLEIYAPDWLSAEEEYLALRQSAQAGAELIAEAARERLKLLGIAEDQIRAIERDNRPNPRVTLYAPEGGVVWELGTRDGMAVSPGMTLFKLASLRTVWVNAEIPETEAELAKPGVPVQARVAAIPDKVFSGQIAMLLPDVNPITRTIKARIVLHNPAGELKPGMFATITLGGREQTAALVPSEAVISTGTRSVVIVADSNGKFHPVDVTLGRESGDMTEIRKGLEKGQRVVVSGQFLIDSESSLKAALNRMNDPVSKP